jgi:hypothetical protein
MMFQLLFRERPAAVKHVCHGCETQRALLRSRGVRTWDRYQALCFRCYGRHLAKPSVERSIAGGPTVTKEPGAKHAAVA